MTLLFLSTLAVPGDATDIGAIVNKSMDAVAPVIKEATTQFFKGQKRFGESCNVRDCEAPWICYREQCQECQTGDETELVDGLMCKFPKICMPMPHDPSKKGCINPAEWVNCGGHYAASCNACPGGNGKDYCNGDCIWSVPAPAAAPAAAPSKALLEPHAATSAAASASEAPVYHTYISAPPAAAASEPPPTCVAKATTAAPPGKIDCSKETSQTCSAEKNCIWVWNGSGLDLATKTFKAPQEDELRAPQKDEQTEKEETSTKTTEKTEQKPQKTEKKPQNILDILEKKGKCYVLESYLNFPAVQTFKKINKQMGQNMDPDQRSESIYAGICDKHSSLRSDGNKGVCEEENEMGVRCTWWNTKLFGGKCVVVNPTDVNTEGGGKCLFPFIYNEMKFDGCTKEVGENKPWCKLDLRKLNALSSLLVLQKWDSCKGKFPTSTGTSIDNLGLNVSDTPDVQCLLKQEDKKLAGKRLDCNKFATTTEDKILQAKNKPYCTKYLTAALKCCKSECEEAGHLLDPATATAGGTTAGGTPALAAPAAALMKQRTTQSFLAADNWE